MSWLLALQWLCFAGLVITKSVEFPNPQKEFRLCGRRNSSYICDPEFLLDIGDVERLDLLAQEFRKSTTCLCSKCEAGISLGIFVKRNLTQESAKQYPSGQSVAEMLRRRWHLGKCNDDIVLILLTELNISDYSMGLAVKKIFPDNIAKSILKDCNVHFLSGWYYQGLESVISSFNDVLVKLQQENQARTMNLIIGVSLGIGFLLILLTFSIIMLRKQYRRRKNGCSNIYESVPTKSTRTNNKYLQEKINEYQLEKIHREFSSDDEEEEEGYMSDEDVNAHMPSRQLLQMKRQLSAVTEESSDENESPKGETKNVNFNSLPNSLQNHPLKVTEL